MRLTRFTDYSLRALVYLGHNKDNRVTIAEISETYGISKNHLMKVVSNLTRMGVVAARRGPGGGIYLNRAAEDISLREIIGNTEKHLQDPGTAGLPDGDRPLEGDPLRTCLQQALQAYLEVLAGFTLADILDPAQDLTELLQAGERAA